MAQRDVSISQEALHNSLKSMKEAQDYNMVQISERFGQLDHLSGTFLINLFSFQLHMTNCLLQRRYSQE